MERNYKPIDWSNFPPIEKCTSFGDTNGNHVDIAMPNIDERVITLDTSKFAMPTPEEIQELQKYGKANWEDYPLNRTPI